MSYTGLVQPTAMTSIEEVIDDTTPLINKVYSSDKVQSGVNALQAEVTPASVLEKVKTVDGLNSGLDADLLRGLPADFTSSLTVSGWQKLPSGLIIQWVFANLAKDTVYSWPIVFPNACLVATGNHPGTGDANPNVLNQTQSGFKLLWPLTTSPVSQQVIAIGY